jgi:cellulose synthase/poly-beta-1,6-N-acetylglucosamine synthase-like glycosyltransferase
MIVFLWCVYLLAATVRLSWWLFFRLKTSTRKALSTLSPAHDAQGISIIVCAHNNVEGLKTLLPILYRQDYPVFEILVVNDRSSDNTAAWLSEQRNSQLKILTIAHTPNDWNAKKYALTQGIRQSAYPILALTDSDCMPLSVNWLNHIAVSLSTPDKDLFLGYSPYEEQPGLLNRVIQTETLFTALQYFSLANNGQTYMGVGRNLAYKKSFIEKHLDSFPFRKHLGGDDDLLISHLSKGKEAATDTHSDSFVLTFPPPTIRSWVQQKRRHLSAGRYYKPFMRTLLSSYWLSASCFWLAFLVLLPLSTGEGIVFLWGAHLLFFIVGSILLLPFFRIFKAVRLLPLFLFWDFLYIASSSIIGFSTFLVKNKKWS